MSPAWETAERVARVAYGRLVAILAAPTGDLALAEDALSGAFERALVTWPESGVPDNPEGWLLTVARNRLRDGRRPATPPGAGAATSTSPGRTRSTWMRSPRSGCG